MLGHQYQNKMDINDPHYDINVREYMRRMQFVANSGCETVMLTGTSEPQQNKQFLATFALLNAMIKKPFENIEMQTTGLFLNGNRDYVRFLRNFVGVNTIALSVNALNDDENNAILGHGLSDRNVILGSLCDLLHEYDFNIRFCFNLSSRFNCVSAIDCLNYAKQCHSSQVTFRVLYTSDENTEQGKWIRENSFTRGSEYSSEIGSLKNVGKNVYGTELKDYDGMSVFFDSNCIGKHKNISAPDAKHYILCPNCKLYSSWDTEASLVF